MAMANHLHSENKSGLASDGVDATVRVDLFTKLESAGLNRSCHHVVFDLTYG